MRLDFVSFRFTENIDRDRIIQIMSTSKAQSVRRILSFFIGALLLLAVFFVAPLPAFADDADASDPTAKLDVPCLIVVDANDPTVVLYEKNADQRCIPGSTMTIMTCILSLELCSDLEQKVTVTAQAAALKDSNSLMGVIRGEQLTIRQLLYGLMLKSGNDAALLLAQTLGGSLEHFVELMNAKAAELGMTHTNFINPSGAYKRDQFSTARDMAILTCYAMKNELFREIVSTVRYSIDAGGVRLRSMTMINSNKLISDPESSRLFYDCAVGVKTGSTAQGGKCLVAAATKNGASVVAVLLGVTEGGSKLDRMSKVYEDAKTIMDLALTEQFVSVSPSDLKFDSTITMPLTGANSTEISLNVNLPDKPIVLSRASLKRIQSDPSVVEAVPSVSFVAAPVSEGDSCGTIDYRINGNTLLTAELVAAESVDTQAGELAVSTVATSAPEVTAPQQESWFTSLPDWLLYIVAALLLGGAGFAVFIFLKWKRSKPKKNHSK